MSIQNETSITTTGPKGWRRLWDAVTAFFNSRSPGPIITAQGAVPQHTVVRDLVAARVRITDPLVKGRAESHKLRLEIWDNELRLQVLRQLELAFHPDNYRRMYWVVHCSTNLMRRVIDDVSVLYENPATRSLKEKRQDQTDGDDSLKKNAEKAGAPAAEDEEPEVDEKEPPTDEEDETEGKRPPFPPKAKQASDEPEDEEQPAGELDTGDPDIDQLAVDLDLSGAEDEEDDTPFTRLMKAYDLDTLLDTVEKMCMVCSVVWVRPYVSYDKTEQVPEGKTEAETVNDASTGKLSYRLYTPAEADVVLDPDNPAEAAAFYYFAEELDDKGQLIKVIHFWNREEYVKFDLEWRVLKTEPNELKRLPVTAFRLHFPRTGYFVENPGQDLYEATLELNVLKTLQNSRAKDGAFKQLAIQGSSDDVPQDLVLGGPAPIMLGDEMTASVLDLTPNLDAFTTMWERREIALATTYGINAAEYKAEGTPQSGFAKRLDRDRVMRESQRRRKFFARGEQDLYSLTAKMLEAYPIPSIGKLDPAAELVVDFAEPTFEEDPQNQARIDALALKQNVISIVDILRRENPDLSDVELIKQAYKNKRINDAFMTPDQMKLADLLAVRANVGASAGRIGQGGAGGPEDGDPSADREEEEPAGVSAPPPPGGRQPPFGR